MVVGGVYWYVGWCRQLESESSSCAKLHQQLQKMSTDLEASLSDLEATNISNMLLRQQVKCGWSV